VFNAVVGIILFELSWCKTSRYRNAPKEMLDMFPAFCRRDAPKWNKLLLYPGAMVLLVPRLVLCILLFSLNVLLLKILLIGQDRSKPVLGCRKKMVNATMYVIWRLMSTFVLFTWHKVHYFTHEEVNYAEYLGTDKPIPLGASIGRRRKLQEENHYQTDEKQGLTEKPSEFVNEADVQTSMVICNHIGFIEIISMHIFIHTGFVIKSELRNTPFIGAVSSAIDSLWVDRAGSQETKDKFIEQMTARQEEVEDKGQNYNPTICFPEGTTTNGACLMPFKRGAF
jgi:1-acyl-sn-glycerol-3-phosphate acyltransferase